MTLYHGGFPGLDVGERILPPTETKSPSCFEHGSIACRRDRIYATVNEFDAFVYAALAPFTGHGDLYEIELDDPIEPDPDCLIPGFSFQAPAGTIVRVVRRHCTVALEELERFVGVFAAVPA